MGVVTSHLTYSVQRIVCWMEGKGALPVIQALGQPITLALPAPSPRTTRSEKLYPRPMSLGRRGVGTAVSTYRGGVSWVTR